jgi:Fur family transcriptional regulator, ferric uptake regulator
MSGDLEDLVTARLQAEGQRFTTGRRRLIDVLSGADAPLTIPQIVAADRGLPQSSVYRNLAILEEVGVVSRIVTSDDFARYELAEDLTEHHHHLICSACGDVSDFSLRPSMETELDRALRGIARRAAFAPSTHRLDLVGLCRACR